MSIGLLPKLQNLLPRAAFITIYKAFIRPQLIMVISFMIKRIIYLFTKSLVITGTIRGTSKEKLCQELDLKSLQLQRWYRKLEMFYKICKSKNPQYFFKLLPEKTSSHVT